MKNKIFKEGDRVYHIDYGWGVIDDISDSENDLHPIQVTFEEDTKYFTIDGRYYDYSKNKSLSFTEYTLQGFSQERPVELPKVGELCLVRDYSHEDFAVRVFCSYDGKYFHAKTMRGTKQTWLQMKRIKILD